LTKIAVATTNNNNKRSARNNNKRLATKENRRFSPRYGEAIQWLWKTFVRDQLFRSFWFVVIRWSFSIDLFSKSVLKVVQLFKLQRNI